jgi:predicted N-acyltransferase
MPKNSSTAWPRNQQVRIQSVASIAEIPAASWNRLHGTHYPFLRHEFLLALEESGCVCPATGWTPCHLIISDQQGTLAGALPLYRKTDSFGEFVFDWAWADAYRRAGLHYYPKIVSAIPYTPASSTRLLYAPGENQTEVGKLLLGAALAMTQQSGASSLHLLFPDPAEMPLLSAAGMMLRKDCQFHWHNRDYASFDDFLGEFTAEKRKKAKRERRRVAEAGISFEHLNGHQVDTQLWKQLMPLYASSFLRRGRSPYLNEDFFRRIAATLPDNLLVILARLQGEPVATAICYRSADTLYGRYWGSTGDFHSLHFETCYYQGIEYCIDNQLRSFEPGTQGEHKIARGFSPTETWSAHWLSHPQFAAAVDNYLERERAHIDEYMDSVRAHVPFRKGTV